MAYRGCIGSECKWLNVSKTEPSKDGTQPFPSAFLTCPDKAGTYSCKPAVEWAGVVFQLQALRQQPAPVKHMWHFAFNRCKT